MAFSPSDKRRAAPPPVEGATLPPRAADPAPTEAETIAGPPGGAGAGPPEVPPELVNHSRYRVLRVLGQGGMGAVYLAEHLVMGRRVALKTIHTRFLANPEAVGRFHREVRVVAKLAHPNVVAAYDADRAGDLHFLIMEYVEGVSLAEYARQKGPLPVEQACAICCQAALGLQHAHEQGLVHRDVKPHNLMVTRKGQVKVLDFGLAHFSRQEEAAADAAHTATGMVLGTADYIAPEQTSSSRNVDIRADVYSLGCTLYFLLSGRVPFPGGTMIDKFVHHAMDAPPPVASLRPGLPAPLVAVVEKMMAKRPEDRYQTPAEVYRALRPFAEPARAAPRPAAGPAKSRPDVAPTEALAEKPSAGRKSVPGDWPRKKVVVIAATVALTAVVLGGLLLAFGLTRSSGGQAKDGGAAGAVPTQPGGTGTKTTTARAVAWSAKGAKHTLIDPDRSLKGILDFREVVGVTPREFRDWQSELGQDFRVSYLSNRNGVGPPLFNAVAVHEREPVPARVFTALTEEEAGKTEERLKAEGRNLRYVAHCAYGESGKYRHSQLWAGEPADGYLWLGTLDFISEKVEAEKAAKFRPYALDAAAVGTDRLYTCFGTADRGVKWKPFFSLSRAELLATVEEYRDEGWRADVLAPHWDGEQFRFLLVVRDNPEHVDWRFRMDMSLQDYKKESAEQKRLGLFPLALTSYGDEVNVRYAAVWVRYRITE